MKACKHVDGGRGERDPWDPGLWRDTTSRAGQGQHSLQQGHHL